MAAKPKSKEPKAKEPETRYIIYENTLYQSKENNFYRSWEPCEVPEEEPAIEWKRAKIPYSLWQWMKAFSQFSYNLLSSETFIQLFYDIEKDEWSAWVPPQITRGMTVDVDETSPNYETQRAQYPSLMAGTLHHHCSTSAFQSGTDKSDENTKEGVHFTLGHLDKDTLSLDVRFAAGGQTYPIDPLTIIDIPFGIPGTASVRERITEALLLGAFQKDELKEYDFSKEIKNVSRAASRGATHGRRVFGGAQSKYEDELDFFAPNPTQAMVEAANSQILKENQEDSDPAEQGLWKDFCRGYGLWKDFCRGYGLDALKETSPRHLENQLKPISEELGETLVNEMFETMETDAENVLEGKPASRRLLMLFYRYSNTGLISVSKEDQEKLLTALRDTLDALADEWEFVDPRSIEEEDSWA